MEHGLWKINLFRCHIYDLPLVARFPWALSINRR